MNNDKHAKYAKSCRFSANGAYRTYQPQPVDPDYTLLRFGLFLLAVAGIVASLYPF